MAERGDADARDQVEVAAPVGGEEPAALAALEHDRVAPVDLEDRLRLDSIGHHRSSSLPCSCAHRRRRSTRVPVAPSKSLTPRPETIATSGTPPRRWRRGRRPASRPSPSAPCRTRSSRRRSRASASGSSRRRVQHAGGAAGDDQPPRAEGAARCPASVSALTLSSVPSGVDTDAGDHRHVAEPGEVLQQRTAGSRPARRRGRGPPVRPPPSSSRSRALDRPIPASAPVRPTARTPRAVQGADERRVRPAGQHRDDRLERCGVGDPQAVDELRLEAAGRAARRRSRVRRRGRRRPARATASVRIAAAIACIAAASSSSSPPSFRTVVVRRCRSCQFSPSVSSNPNATLKFWIAWPAAPFTRLSITATITSCPPGRRPASRCRRSSCARRA